MKQKPIPVYLTLPEPIYQQVDQLAREHKRSKCRYIRQIIRRYLEYLDKADKPDAPPVNWKID